MVSMLAIGPKDRGFISGEGDACIRAINIISTPFFGAEETPLSHDTRFYGILTKTTSMTEIFRRQNPSFSSP
jgi:hypothetical protein